jgi:CheY-like chemotaxis protein
VSIRHDDSTRGARILIVDDERQNRTLLEVMLEPEGYVVESADSGENALAMVAHCAPHLILLDVMMPGMNGYVVASRLKANPATRDIPIILLSSLDDRNSRAHGLGAGADAFLSKPASRQELTQLVREQLRLGGEASRRAPPDSEGSQ